jgi:hypothetical protein
VITPDRLPVELWCLSTMMLSRVFDLVFCKTLFIINIVYCDIGYSVSIFLYGMCVNLIHDHTYYEHLVLA